MTLKVALIDHYDSFTFNVIDWLASAPEGVDLTYIAHDNRAAVRQVLESRVPLVLSPGPKRPEDAPETLAMIEKSLERVPILGICLGHQMLATVVGAHIKRCKTPCHGTRRIIRVRENQGLFAGFPPDFQAAVYNSLTVDAVSLPPKVKICAEDGDGEIQGLDFFPDATPIAATPAVAWGVQFHPESFMSEQAARLRANWLARVQAWQSGRSE